MAAVARRTAPARSLGGASKGAADDGKSLWSSLLESVATSKRLPEKTLLILGGTVETQKNFLEAVASDPAQRRRPAERTGTRKPLVANRFALGYTYQDVLDSDQDDILARLSEYMLAEPDPSFTPLIRPLFTRKSVPDLAITILLDWGEPWHWLRQLRDWIRAVRAVLATADADVQEALEENAQEWRQRRRGGKGEAAPAHDYDGALPTTLGPGEWDEPLGVPLCVVCQNAEKIEILEREQGWKEYDFDTVLVYMRTVLLKHGASLVYTASAAPGSLPTLVRSVLDIRSILQRNPLKHNVNDRDKVLVPPNWDSWGKIRPLREGFDFEAASRAWSLDLQSGTPAVQEPAEEGSSAVTAYEALIRNPHSSTADPHSSQAEDEDPIEVKCESNQDFFARQLDALDKFKAEDEAAAKKARSTRDGKKGAAALSSRAGGDVEQGRLSDHIGPVQFNMGGIQVDADQMLQSLKEREAGRASSALASSSFAGSTPVTTTTTVLSSDEDDAAALLAPITPFATSSTPDGKSENDQLRSFFASLASRGGTSATNSPRGEGK